MNEPDTVQSATPFSESFLRAESPKGLRALICRYMSAVSAPSAQTQILHRLARGASWSVAGAVASRGMQLLSSVIAAHMLGKAGFGEFAIVQTTVATCGAFAGFGIGTTETRYVSKYVSTDPARAGRIIALCSRVAWVTSLVTAAVLFLSAAWIARVALANSSLTSALQLSAILVLATNVNAAQLGALAGLEAFQSIAAVNFWSGLSSPLLMWAGVTAGGLRGAIGALIISVGIAWIVSHWKIRNARRAASVPAQSPGWLRERDMLWRFSLPLFAGMSVHGPASWACTALLARLPGGYAELGVFNAAYQLKRVPEIIVGILMSPVLPVITERKQIGDLKGYRQALRSARLVCFLILMPAAVLFALFPRPLLRIFGPQFAGSESVLQAFAIHLLALALFLPSSTALASAGKMWAGAAINAIGAGVYVGLSLLLIPKMKGTGLAVAYGINFLVAYSITHLYIRSLDAPGLSRKA